MKRFLTDRVDRFGALGQAALSLLRAESVALRGELEGNARRLLAVALIFAFALFMAFWALGALVLSAVELGALWLPRWGAALVVVGVLALAALILVAIARRRLARLETPAATVRRRAEEYQDWWERRIGGPVASNGGRDAGEEPAATADSEL